MSYVDKERDERRERVGRGKGRCIREWWTWGDERVDVSGQKSSVFGERVRERVEGYLVSLYIEGT